MVGASRRNRWRQPAQRAVALLLVAGCAVLLVEKSADGVRSTNSLSSQTSIDRATSTDEFYNCIANQVKQLIGEKTTVRFVGGPSSSQAQTLIGAAGSWFTVARSSAEPAETLGLEVAKGNVRCSGLVVYSIGKVSNR